MFLFFQSYIPNIEVVEETVYTVKRSDNDLLNQNWPLFFVQIQDDRLLDIIDQYLDCLVAVKPLPKEDIVRNFLYCQLPWSMLKWYEPFLWPCVFNKDPISDRQWAA